jgi:hypothetical protein
MRKLYISLFAFLIPVIFINSQESNSGNYQDIIKMKYSIFNGPILFYQDKESHTDFGISKDFEKMFSEDAMSLKNFQKYKLANTLGNVFSIGGLGVELGGLAYIISQSNTNASATEGTKISGIMIISGFASVICGSIFNSISYINLFDAINNYNRYKLN